MYDHHAQKAATVHKTPSAICNGCTSSDFRLAPANQASKLVDHEPWSILDFSKLKRNRHIRELALASCRRISNVRSPPSGSCYGAFFRTDGGCAWFCLTDASVQAALFLKTVSCSATPSAIVAATGTVWLALSAPRVPTFFSVLSGACLTHNFEVGVLQWIEKTYLAYW